MTNFNFLSKSGSRSCGLSSVTLALTVGSPSAHRRGIMLKLISVLVLILTFSVGQMWGASPATSNSFSSLTGNIGSDSNISYAAYQGSATTASEINNSRIKLYRSTGNNSGGVLVITANNGVKITKINVTFTGTLGYRNSNSTSSTSRTSYTSLTSGSDVTISNWDYIQISNTIAKNTSTQAFISAITVTYSSSGGGGGGGTTYSVTYNKNNGSGTMTDSNSPYSSGATVTTLPNSFTRSNYIFTGWNTQAGGSGTAYAENATFSISGNTTLFAQWVASSLNDHINRGTTGVTSGSTSYSNWSGKTATSSAVYAGNSAGGNNSIQLRTNNSNSGVVTTKSGGKAKYITVTWNASTSSGRKIDIYGKNSAYSLASDLFSNQSTTQGEYLGTIAYEKQTVLAISGDYEYIGIRSQDGALYLSDIYIEWEACQPLGSINGSFSLTHPLGAFCLEKFRP